MFLTSDFTDFTDGGYCGDIQGVVGLSARCGAAPGWLGFGFQPADVRDG